MRMFSVDKERLSLHKLTTMQTIQNPMFSIILMPGMSVITTFMPDKPRFHARLCPVSVVVLALSKKMEILLDVKVDKERSAPRLFAQLRQIKTNGASLMAERGKKYI